MNEIMKFDQYTMRLIQKNDLDNYYDAGFKNSDKASMHYTGTVNEFSKEQVASYINKIVDDEQRYDFLIIENHKIIGEVVLNEFEDETCNYRICLFKEKDFSKGIGYRSTKCLFDWAFEHLSLKAIVLEVFPFNERGRAMYHKLGFKNVDVIHDDEAEEPYYEIIMMRLTREDYLSM